MATDLDWVVLLRVVAITELVLVLGLLLKQGGHNQGGHNQGGRPIVLRLSQLFVICLICYLFSEALRPESIAERPPMLWYLLVAVALAIPALYWALARLVFMDSTIWGRTERWVMGGYWLISVLFLAADFVWKFVLQRAHLGLMTVPLVLQISLSLWTLYIIVESWRSDLMEPRRRLRLVAATLIGAYTLFALIFELTGINQTREASALLVHTASIAVMGLVGMLMLAEIRLDNLYHWASDAPTAYSDTPSVELSAASQPAPVAESVPGIEDWETCLTRIRDERLYTLENMTIAKLAELLAVPEYRLRGQIVQSTPFKNFNQFLNYFRIDEAARRLRSDQDAHLPILSIALDVGFRSLPSFNRSFKDHYQMTPSEYRKTRAG
jgi:AraC-like DNA-binding protein